VATAPPHQKAVEEEPHDDFSDLLDYVLNNAADVDVKRRDSEGVLAKSSVAVPSKKKKKNNNNNNNPTLGELMNIPAR
jgi:hypothetical protein